jgi:hypothetical protein
LHAGDIADIVDLPASAGPSRLTALENTMKTGAPRFFRRSIVLAAAGILAVTLTACTGSGGGSLPPGPTASDTFPDTVFTGKATFSFNFSCEDKGGINPPTGQLRLQLTYSDHGTNQLLSSPFSIQGTADELDPVVESEICSGQLPPPGGNELIFLGRYRPTTSPPPGFPQSCPRRETSTSPLCRFEVIVQDTDGNLAGSKGDFFSIKLSSSTAVTSELDPLTVFYARAGYLESGNLKVK